jgi:TATA-box binding protein (TBP) (component of TFIID and TFIIIB)
MEDIESAWSDFCEDNGPQHYGILTQPQQQQTQPSTATTRKTKIISNANISKANAKKANVSEANVSEANLSVSEEIIANNAVPILPKGSAPKCSALNISTKTKISYLNYPIDLKTVFWKIPLVTYHEPTTGVIKKQMKFNSTTPAEVSEIETHRDAYSYVDEYIINQINNPEGNSRIKFKDIRKLSFGICRKDINSYRCKKKSAFYNCFVVILRLLHNDRYKEIHIKVFNTGKLEIPGIQDSDILNKVLDLLIVILKPLIDVDATVPLKYLEEQTETVMINSNFGCGYFINREKLTKIISLKYKINSNYDPCSYPGIQCEFYHDPLLMQQHGMFPSSDRSKLSTALDALPESAVSKVSFMIFRTGSVLIVGKCSEETLYKIYDFLCELFQTEYNEIHVINNPTTALNKEKTRKIRKKIIMV